MIIVGWDFNDPTTMPVLFRDEDGNTCEGKVELWMDTWVDGLRTDT